MIGMCKHTGKRISGLPYLEQRLETLLSTPLVTRVLRRVYGSELPRLVDRPVTDEFAVDLYAATALAILRWEPELRLKRVQQQTHSAGHVVLILEGDYVDAEGPLTDVRLLVTPYLGAVE